MKQTTGKKPQFPADRKKQKRKRFPLLKRLLELARKRASKNQYFLEIGVHFLKKGCNYQIGQIIDEKKLDSDRYRVTVITGLFYDFKQNRINHTAEKRVVKLSDIKEVENIR